MASSSIEITSLTKCCLPLRRSNTSGNSIAPIYSVPTTGYPMTNAEACECEREVSGNGVDALDRAVAGEGDRTAAEVTRNVRTQRELAGGERILGRVDGQ